MNDIFESPASAMTAEALLNDALHLMKSALALLDEADAPGEVGAHLDLAKCRLIETIEARVWS